MFNSTFNENKCWGCLQSNSTKQCSYKKSVGNFCKKHYVLWKKGRLVTIHDNNIMNIKTRNTSSMSYDLDKYIIAIQSLNRGHFIRKNIKLRGISVYCRHLTNNKTDCIDLGEISQVPPYLYFSITENNIHWGFSIKSFKYILKYNQRNPYSINEISNKDIDRFNKLNNTIKNINLDIMVKKDSLFMDIKYIKLQQECMDVFQLLDNLNNYTKCRWFLSLPLIRLKSLYIFMEDMWNYRLNLSKQLQLNYISNGILFNITVADIKKNNDYYKMAYILLNEFKRLLTEGKTVADKTTASHWILSGLTLVNMDARNSLPWLYQSAVL